MADNKNELDRRSFMKSLMLGTGALASTPFDIYLSNMMIHFLGQGYAHAADDVQSFADNKLIHFSMAGGCSRWYWDLPLRPNGDDVMGNDNKMLITKFTSNNGAITGGSYETTQIGSYHMPYLWSGLIPVVGGGSVPMSQLAENMLILRGINLQIDSHDLDRTKQMVPVAGTSMLGMVADEAKTPIPAASYNAGNGYYFSKKGIGNVNTYTGNANPIKTALDPFIISGTIKSVNDSSMESAIDKALLSLSQRSGGKNKFLPTTYEQRLNAKKMMQKGFTNLDGEFTSLRNKYATLIGRSFGDPTVFLSGVDDSGLASDTNSRLFNISINGDIRYTGSDIRSLTDTSTTIYALASGMAVAEYMITNGLSSSVNVVTSDYQNVKIDSGFQINDTSSIITNRVFGATLDTHETGAYTALIMQSRYSRAYSACLYELISQLKNVRVGSGSLFDKTAIAVTSEFNRRARTDGSGADHGWDGSNFTIYSGQVPSLTVLGNIENIKTGGHTGMWGRASGVDEIGGREALIGNVSSTLSTILDLKSPTPNDMSFVYRSGNKILPFFKRPKNKAA